MQNLLWHRFVTRASQTYNRLLVTKQHDCRRELPSAYSEAAMNSVLHASNGQMMMAFLYWGSSDITVSNVTILQAPWLRNQGSVSDTGLLQGIHNSYEAHPAPYHWLPGTHSPGDTAAGVCSWPLNLHSPTCLHVMALIKHGDKSSFIERLTMLSVPPTMQDNYWIMNWIWRDQLHFEDQGTGNTPNPSWTWWWWWTGYNTEGSGCGLT
jgi:hypothetical protein